MSHDLYICHSKRDEKVANAVCAALEKSGLSCWIAPRDLPPGASWGEAIIDAISVSRLVVLIFSSRANQSPYIEREVERSISIGIPIIPFRIEDVQPSGTFEYFLGSYHWLEAVTRPLENHIQELLDETHRILLSRPRSPEPIVARESPVTQLEKYDAFISYRRESGAAEARLIRAELREKKIRAFLDVDDLRSGHFNVALLRRIAEAPNFIVILSPNALDRCSEKEDWLRKEIAQAVATRRNIIPIMLRGFEFPDRDSLPDELKPLPTHNGLEYSHKYFNAMIAEILNYLCTEESLQQRNRDTTPLPSQAVELPDHDAAHTHLTFKKLIDDPGSFVGRKVQRYIIKQLIGSGGSGFVYRALHPALGIDVCIKIFYPLKQESQQAAAIVARGVRGLAAMNHPNIIKVFDFERFALADASSFFLVMELVKGQRLDEWSEKLEASDAVEARLRMAIAITSALAAAHKCRYVDQLGFEQTGVLHGDLKPGNIMVRDDSPVILDFMMLDVQRLLDPIVVPSGHLTGMDDEPLTASYGTPGFMSPEQDRDGIVTVRSDIFGLGVTFAYLFFPGAPSPVFNAFAENENDGLREVRSLVRSMVAEDPNDRPQNMGEVAGRLMVCAEELRQR